MEALKPPSELRAGHDALLRVLHRRFSGLDDRETIARVSDLERRYRALGLERCADQQAQTLSVLRRPPTGDG